MSANHHRLNLSAGMASVLVAVLLVAVKFWALGQTGALSVAASLTDSALDLVISLTGLLAIVYAARPADDDHAYGHTSAEDLAALGQALLVTVSACAILWGATHRLLAGDAALAAEGAGIVAMLVASVLTGALVLWQRFVAARTGNRVVAADSLHYLSDFLPNIGAIVALAASAHLGLASIDSVIAIAAALFLLFGAFKIGKGAFDALMDRRAPPEDIARLEEIIGNWPGVYGFHDLKTRTAGNKVFVQVHIELDPEQTLFEAHAIGADMKRHILQTMPQVDLLIHKDPHRKTGDAD